MCANVAADPTERLTAEMLRDDCLRYIAGLTPLLLRYARANLLVNGGAYAPCRQRGIPPGKRGDDAARSCC